VNTKIKFSSPMSAMIALAIIISLVAIGIVGMQYRQMGAITQALQEVKDSIPEKQSPEDFQKSLVGALNQLAAEKAAAANAAKLEKYANAQEEVPGGKHIYGNLKARFSLVEFSDLECPFCKRFHDTPRELVDVSNGNVNWQWMHLPLDFHNPAAKVEAHAAECVAEQKGNRAFFAFLEDVFTESAGNGQGAKNIAAMAASFGVDEQEFVACMKEGRYNSKIEEHTDKARQKGISGTPATFVVDNQTGNMQLVSGAQPGQALLAAISKLKAESEATQAQSDGE